MGENRCVPELAPPRPSWDRWANLYGLQEWLEGDALNALVELLARRGSPDGSLLDVATGRGALLHSLARSERPPRRAIGIDTSPRMLAGVGGLPAGWRVGEGDARELPFADGEFTVVTAAYLLHTIERSDRDRFLAEAHRVLAPGGCLGVVTVVRPAAWPGRIVMDAVDTAAELSNGLLAGLRTLDPRAELERAGFVPVAGRRTARGYPSLSMVATRGD